MISYDFEAKQRYRQHVWSAVESFMAVPRWMRNVWFLDTRDGLEARYLLARGYNPHRLNAVNMNPAEVALLTSGLRRDGMPDVQTHGVDLVRAVMRASTLAHVIHFDSTTCLHGGLYDVSESLACMVAPGGVLVVNFLGGREGPNISANIADTKIGTDYALSCVHDRRTSAGEIVRTSNHHARVVELLRQIFGLRQAYHLGEEEFNAAGRCRVHLAARAKWGSYVSTSGQPMVWVAIKLKPHRESFERLMERRNVEVGWHFELDVMPVCMMQACAKDLQKEREEKANRDRFAPSKTGAIKCSERTNG